MFDKETTAVPDCYGDCAVAWPPVLTAGSPVAGDGAMADLVGTTHARTGPPRSPMPGTRCITTPMRARTW